MHLLLKLLAILASLLGLGGRDEARLLPYAGGNAEQSSAPEIENYSNRSFDPATGRFLQRDPVLGGDELFNPYCFPGNNPVTNADPMGTGHWVEVRLVDEDGNPVDPPVKIYVLDPEEKLEEAKEKAFGKRPQLSINWQNYSIEQGLKPFDPSSADPKRRLAAKLGYTDIEYMNFRTLYLIETEQLGKIATNKAYWKKQAADKNALVNEAIAEQAAAIKEQEAAAEKERQWLAPRRRGHPPVNPWNFNLTTKKGLSDWVKSTTGLTIDPEIIDLGDPKAEYQVDIDPANQHIRVKGFDLTKTEHQSIVLSSLIHEAAATAKARAMPAMGIAPVEANALTGYVSGLHDWGIYNELLYQDKTGQPVDQGYLEESLPLKVKFRLEAKRARNHDVLVKLLNDYSKGIATSGKLEITGRSKLSTVIEEVKLPGLPPPPP